MKEDTNEAPKQQKWGIAEDRRKPLQQYSDSGSPPAYHASVQCLNDPPAIEATDGQEIEGVDNKAGVPDNDERMHSEGCLCLSGSGQDKVCQGADNQRHMEKSGRDLWEPVSDLTGRSGRQAVDQGEQAGPDADDRAGHSDVEQVAAQAGVAFQRGDDAEGANLKAGDEEREAKLNISKGGHDTMAQVVCQGDADDAQRHWEGVEHLCSGTLGNLRDDRGCQAKATDTVREGREQGGDRDDGREDDGERGSLIGGGGTGQGDQHGAALTV